MAQRKAIMAISLKNVITEILFLTLFKILFMCLAKRDETETLMCYPYLFTSLFIHTII